MTSKRGVSYLLVLIAVCAQGCADTSGKTADAAADADVDDLGDAGQLPKNAVGELMGADDYSLRLGPVQAIYQPVPQSLMGGFPSAAAIDDVDSQGRHRKKVFVGFSQGDDTSSAVSKGGRLVSLDGGESFPADSFQDDTDLFNFVRLDDGSLLSVGFTDIVVDGSAATLKTFLSDDNGSTWQRGTASLDVGAENSPSWLRMHRGVIVLPDAEHTLLLPFYGSFIGDAGWRIGLIQSINQGVSWTLRSTIAVGTNELEYNEPNVVQVADGSLLAVTRTALASGAIGPLMFARSADLGHTWSALENVRLPVGDGAPSIRPGVDPVLALLPNGALLLAAGRNDNWISVSADGRGDSWQPSQLLYVNYPSQNRTRGSSGYMGLAPVSSNRALLAGDNCANTWGCPASDSGHTVDGLYRIWTRMAHVLTSDLRRIDLAGQLERGLISIDTDMNYVDPIRRETGPGAVFDGSIDPWSSAIADAKSEGTFKITLDGEVLLTRVGISTSPGFPSRARVYASANGTSYDTLLVDTGERTDFTIRYYSLPTPVPARKLMVRVDSAGDCGVASRACVGLNELELYSTVESFENEALGLAPRGYQDAKLATVQRVEGNSSSHALRLHDTSTTSRATVSRSIQASEKVSLKMRVKPDALGTGFLFDIVGQSPGGARAVAYHLGVFSDGSLQRYDLASKTWIPVSEAGVIPLKTWSDFSLDATTSEAVLTINAALVFAIPLSETGSSLDGIELGSGGTATVGDDIWIDDVVLTSE